MTPATRWHSLCLFYLAEECHFYLAPTRSRSDNKDYVKLGALGQRLFLGSQCFLNGLGPQACSRALVGI